MITGWVALEDASLSEEEEEEKEHGMLEWEWEEKNLMELKSMNYPDLQHLPACPRRFHESQDILFKSQMNSLSKVGRCRIVSVFE